MKINLNLCRELHQNSLKKIFGNTEAAVHGCYGANSQGNTRDGILLQ